MSGEYVLVTVRQGEPISLGDKSSDIENLKKWQKYADNKYQQDGFLHIIVPVGKKGQSTVVTVSNKNPRYSSVGKPIPDRAAREASIWSDRQYGKAGFNSFVVTSDGKYIDP